MRAVIFDLDGTLIDSAPEIHAIANAVLAEEGVAPITAEQSRSFIGHGLEVFITRLMAAVSLPQDAAHHTRMMDMFSKRYRSSFTHTRLYPQVRETLAILRADGLKLGLCTNKPLAATKAVLTHFNLTDFFPVVIGGDSLPLRKPDPAPLLAARNALVAPATVFVGDSEVDAETARNAALPFALFTKGYRQTPPEALPHAARFSHFPDLPAIAARLLA